MGDKNRSIDRNGKSERGASKKKRRKYEEHEIERNDMTMQMSINGREVARRGYQLRVE